MQPIDSEKIFSKLVFDKGLIFRVFGGNIYIVYFIYFYTHNIYIHTHTHNSVRK